MSGALAGIKVLDLTRVLAGPYATMILADLGAEVIKVEQPEVGDIGRRNWPFINGVSSYFMGLNRGKKSITANLATDEGKQLVIALAKGCDVLVENFVPGTMKKFGLDYEEVKRHNPALIYASCSGFGQTGPYAAKPALDAVVQGMGGIMSITGEDGGPPLRPGASVGDIVAGLFLTIGILAALQEREKSGRGQMVDVAMLDCQIALLENAFARYFATGEVPHATGSRHPLFTPFQAFETGDGYIVVAIVGSEWPLFCAVLDIPEFIDDPRFQSSELRSKNYSILQPVLEARLKTRTNREWLIDLEAVGIPCGPVNTIDTVVTDPQVKARKMIVPVDYPGLGKVKLINSPIKLSRTPARIIKPSPPLGGNTEEILTSWLGMNADEIEKLRGSGGI